MELEALVKVLWPIVQGASPLVTLFLAVLLFLERKERQESQRQERESLERVLSAIDMLRQLQEILRTPIKDRST